MKNIENILLCAPCNLKEFASMGVSYTPAAGMQRKPCCTCKQDCWAGPKQLYLLQCEPDQTVIMCILCAIKSGEMDPKQVKSLNGISGRMTLPQDADEP